MPPPEPSRSRVEGLDLARAVAILAMVLINFQVFLLSRPGEQLDGLPWRWLIHTPSGRSSALFVTLAGAGIALLSRSPERGRARVTLLKRALFLLAAGNLLILVWRIDILHFYAFFLALAALVFLDFTRRELLGAAVAVTLFAALLDYAFEWPEPDYWSVRGMATDVLVGGIHPVLPWIAFVLVGMWIGRADLTDRGTRRRLLLGAATGALVAELASTALGALAAHGAWPGPLARLLGTGWSPEPLYVAGAASTSVLAICVCQEVAERWPRATLVRALVATGQLSLSIYVLHALVGVGIPRWLLGLSRAMDWPALTLYWAGFVVTVVLGAYAYRARLARGPLEWVMRKVAGATPPVAPRAPAAARREPPRWPWAFIALAALALAAIRVTGLAPPTLGCGEPVALEGRAASELTLSCPRRTYLVRVDRAREVRLETRSSLDLYLELWGPTKRIAADDDSGEGLDARITRRLEPGTYRAVVRPYHRDFGPFALVVE
ncbi:MAG: DUF1624 domain-containing protein [Sandaracinaceae bacterium]|nr:DUF1624 domain-containing protein [Sandaracinaceae bacterium]